MADSASYANGMAIQKRDGTVEVRNPGQYTSNNLTVGAWIALSNIQSAARMSGLNPSKSTVLIAALRVAEDHMDELVATLEGPE